MPTSKVSEDSSNLRASPTDDTNIRGQSPEWPEESGSEGWWPREFVQRWNYGYMSRILDKGSRQTFDDGTHLNQEDLYRVPKRMEAKLLLQYFREYFEETRSSKRRLATTLWRLAAPTFIPAGFCQFITVVCQSTLPLLVREILRVLEENPREKVVKEGAPYALSLFALLVLNALGNHRHRHLATKSGVVMRAAAVSIVYDHVLRLAPKGRLGLTSGEVANLVAVDTQKLYEVAQEGHLVWSLPLAILLVTVFLLLVLGPTTLVGVTVLLFFVPLVERITSSMLAIRKERVKMTDKRVEIVNAMLQGIKITKLNSYEKNYEKRITTAREGELVWLRRELAVWGISLMMIVASPVLATATTFAAYVLVSDQNILTASKAFSVLLLFSALRFPINYAGRLIGKAAQAVSAIKRITSFLERDVRDVQHDGPLTAPLGQSETPLILKDAAFRVGGSGEGALDIRQQSQSFSVAKFDLSVEKGEVLAICGPVGSGKSTLINGIIGEVATLTSGSTVSTSGNVSYVPQSPFIMSTTLRENILFGRAFDVKWYEKVVEACCLLTDFEQLGALKDLTEIGERGVTLSGGQKQRVSLARAAYGKPDLILLDDPLSALDAGTAKLVFERLMGSSDCLFRETATVLVTHASHFLHRVNKVMVIVDGENKFLGSWGELATFRPADDKTNAALEFVRSSIQEHEATEETKESTAVDHIVDTNNVKLQAIMSVEHREHGLSSLHTWLLWFRRAGGAYFLLLQILFMAIDRFAYVLTEYWLALWTDAAEGPITVLGKDFPSQLEGRSAQFDYLAVYAVILVISISATTLRSEWAVTGGARAAKAVFTSMVSSVLRAPMWYFETTPMGRILNRFTYDIEVVDITLTQNMSMFIISCSWYVAGVAVKCTIVPWIALVVFPVTVLYYFLLLYYRKSGADLQRLDAVSRSPIQAMVTEGLDGSSSIRVFKQESSFLKRFQNAVDGSSSALLNFISAQRWLGFRIELLGSVVVLASSLLVICMNDVLRLDPGIVGLLIVWSSNFTITLGFLVDTFSDVEAAITAIERVDAMANLPCERPMETEGSIVLPESWPQNGRLEFENVCLRYRAGLPLALNNLSFEIPAGKSCGVVGRTGAGKSSLTAALFRLVEIESGHIRLDGIDLATIGLSDVRGRSHGMAIIPQDPFLAGSTLRECLDPFGHSSDTEILDCLKAVRLADEGASLALLDDRLQEGGSNYSVGERQLLNLCGALLRKCACLVLDEATASIDGETDAFIQKMLRTRFVNTTLVTIAHRLNTIMDYDLILAMDAGRAVEFGTPAELLKKNGKFSALVDATGAEGSRALRGMVK